MPIKKESTSKKVHVNLHGVNRAGYMTANKRVYDDGTITTDTLYTIYPNEFYGSGLQLSGGAKAYRITPSGKKYIDYFRKNPYAGQVTYDSEYPWYEQYPLLKKSIEFVKNFGK